MKSAIALQQFKKCIILFIVGIGCSSLTYMIYIIDPLTRILEYNLQMSPRSLLFSVWRKPPFDMYIKVYVFNITNPVEFLSGKEKIKLEEIGPYVYQEFITNDNITFNDNNTMTYVPKRTVVFIPEMSNGNPAVDMVSVPNVPFLGYSSALNDAGFLVNYPYIQFATLIKAKPILNLTVHSYLWGYEDSLINMGSKVLPNFFNFQKLGLLDRLYDEGENIVTMILNKKDDMREEQGRYLSIDTFNGSPGMAQWGYIETGTNETRKENTICNRIQGSTEGVIYPPDLDKRAIFRIFRKSFCRPLPVMFTKEVTEQGLPGYVYTLTNDFADPPDLNPDNECYCRHMKTCLRKGLFDVTPCYYKIPVAVSLPHFLDGDPSLLENNVEGIKPDRKKHHSHMIIQKDLGVPLFFTSKMQINLVMQHLRHNYKITMFSDLTIPLFWFDLTCPGLPTYLLIVLHLTLRILPVTQTILMYLLGIIGATTSVLSLISVVRIFINQQQKQEQESNEDPDLRISLRNGQYTSINILPTIKRITSKTDCLIDD